VNSSDKLIDNRNGGHLKAQADAAWQDSLPPQPTPAAVIEQHAQEVDRIVAWIWEFAATEEQADILRRAARNLYRMGRLHQVIEGGV
jgi:hypothetical protein